MTAFRSSPRLRVSVVGPLVALAFLVAADAPPESPETSKNHLLYEPIESPEARKLLDQAVAFARKRLGSPAIPVRAVHLRRSTPREGEGGAQKPLRRGFRLTEIVDARDGVFAIYLSARPGEAAFEGQLAHEAFHLQNARLRDAYVEGFNSLLAEEFLGELGRPWDHWRRHFESGKEPLYGATYSLLKELAQAAGRETVDRILRFAVTSDKGPDRMEIDIDRWLDSLGPEARARAAAAIARRHDEIDAVRRREQPELAFRRPHRG